MRRHNVSVIIPTYNRSGLVIQAIKSVLAQKIPPHEIIVVDDGSTDDTVKRIMELSDRRIKIITQENKGASASRNKGVSVSTGELLAFLDSDDLWKPEKLACQLELLEREKAEMVYGYLQEFTGTDLPESLQTSSQKGICATLQLIYKEAFSRVGNFDEKITVGEFIDWYHRAKVAGIKESVSNEVLAFRRIHEGNMDRLQRSDTGQYAQVLKSILDRKRNLS